MATHLPGLPQRRPPWDWPRTLVARGSDALAIDHLRSRPALAPEGVLHCFVLDCSASMRTAGRLARAKGVLLALMDEAYQRRDSVALLCFGGSTAELRMPPQRAAAWNEAWVAAIGGGGGTPLTLAVRQADALLAKQPAQLKCLWLLTDGRSREQPARPVQADVIHVLGFEPARSALHLPRRLARAWGAHYAPGD